jgi:hypothetical protein
MYTDLTRRAQTEALLRGGHDDSPPEPLPDERYQISILRTHAIGSAMRGATEKAINHLEAAAEIASRLMLPGDEWVIRRDLGSLFVRCALTAAAHTEWTRALDVLRRLAEDLPPELADGLRRAQHELMRDRAALE